MTIGKVLPNRLSPIEKASQEAIVGLHLPDCVRQDRDRNFATSAILEAPLPNAGDFADVGLAGCSGPCSQRLWGETTPESDISCCLSSFVATALHAARQA